jgi:hypothetical protein
MGLLGLLSNTAVRSPKTELSIGGIGFPYQVRREGMRR